MDRNLIFKSQDISEGIRLFHHRSAKWKTEVMKLVFVGEPDHEIAARSLGAYLLRHGHAGLRGQNRVSGLLHDLYGAGFSTFVSKFARRHLMTLRGVAVDPGFLPGSVDPLAKLFGFMSRVVNEPWFADSRFDPNRFYQERQNLLRAIDSIADNKSQYADQRLVEEMFKGHPMSVPAYGMRSEVESCESPAVVDAIRRLVTKSPVLVYVCSPRSTRDVRRLVRDHLNLEPRKELGRSRLSMPPLRARARTIREPETITQCRLAMGFRIEDYRRRRDVYPATLADAVFGGSSSSRLFKVVRERHSLAYSVGSSFDAGSGTIYVSAGIDPENASRVVNMVRRQARSVAGSSITANEVSVAMASMGKSLSGMWDSPEGLMSFDLSHRLGNRRETDPDALLARFRRVRPGAMAEVFERLKLDTVFVLGKAEAAR